MIKSLYQKLFAGRNTKTLYVFAAVMMALTTSAFASAPALEFDPAPITAVFKSLGMILLGILASIAAIAVGVYAGKFGWAFAKKAFNMLQR